MRKTLTAKDYRLMSALCQMVGLVLIAVLLLAGRPDFAVLMFVSFWIGAACASFGARPSRFINLQAEFDDMDARVKAFRQQNRMDR